MINLVKGGTPSNLGDLFKWSYEQATYRVDPITNTGFFYIRDGYIFQTIYDKVQRNEQLEIKCSFKSTDINKVLGNMYLYIHYSNDSTDTIVIPLDYSNINFNKSTWVTTAHKYSTDKDKDIKKIELRIVSNRAITLNITEIAIFYSGTNSSNNGYNVNDFQDKSILYGFDDNKPKLR